MSCKPKHLIIFLLIPSLIGDPVLAAASAMSFSATPVRTTAVSEFRTQAITIALNAVLRGFSRWRSSRFRRDTFEARRALTGGEVARLMRLAANLENDLKRTGATSVRLNILRPHTAALLARILNRPIVYRMLLDRSEAQALIKVLQAGAPFTGAEKLQFRHHRPLPAVAENGLPVPPGFSTRIRQSVELAVLKVAFRLFVDARGLDNIPDRPVIFVGNHIPTVDPRTGKIRIGFDALVVMFAIKAKTGKLPAVVANPQAYRVDPTIERFLNDIHVINVEPGKTASRIKDYLRTAEGSLLIFPAGMVQAEQPDIEKWNPTIGVIAAETGRPVIPVSVLQLPPNGRRSPRFRLRFARPQEISGGKKEALEQFESVKAVAAALYSEISMGVSPGSPSSRTPAPQNTVSNRDLFVQERLNEILDVGRRRPLAYMSTVDLQVIDTLRGQRGFAFDQLRQLPARGLEVRWLPTETGGGRVFVFDPALLQQYLRQNVFVLRSARIPETPIDFINYLNRNDLLQNGDARSRRLIDGALGRGIAHLASRQFQNTGRHRIGQLGFSKLQADALGPELYQKSVRMTWDLREKVADLFRYWMREREQGGPLQVLLDETPAWFESLLYRIPKALLNPKLTVHIDDVPHRVEIMLVPPELPFERDGISVDAFPWVHQDARGPLMTLFVHSTNDSQGPMAGVDMAALIHDVFEYAVLPEEPDVDPGQHQFLATLSELVVGGNVESLPSGWRVPVPDKSYRDIMAHPDPEEFLRRTVEVVAEEIPDRYPQRYGKKDQGQDMLSELNAKFTYAMHHLMEGMRLQDPVSESSNPKVQTANGASAEDKAKTHKWLNDFRGPSVPIRSLDQADNRVYQLSLLFARKLVTGGLAVAVPYGKDQILMWYNQARRLNISPAEPFPELTNGFASRPVETAQPFTIQVRNMVFVIKPSLRDVKIGLPGDDPSDLIDADPIPMNVPYLVGRNGCNYGDADWDLAPIQFQLKVKRIAGSSGAYAFEFINRAGEDLYVNWIQHTERQSGPERSVTRMLAPLVGPLWLGWQIYHSFQPGTHASPWIQQSVGWGWSAFLAGGLTLAWHYLFKSSRPLSVTPADRRVRELKTAA